jgi:hypothetical protein
VENQLGEFLEGHPPPAGRHFPEAQCARAVEATRRVVLDGQERRAVGAEGERLADVPQRVLHPPRRRVQKCDAVAVMPHDQTPVRAQQRLDPKRILALA